MTSNIDTTKTDVHLTIKNHGGSVEHYYHFLLGFFVPLMMERKRLMTSGDVGRIYVRSCAVLDAVIRAVGCPEVVIVDKAAHQGMREAGRGPDGAPLRLLEVEGFDSPDKYDLADFAGVAADLRRRLAADIAAAAADIERGFSGDGPRIVLIDREPPHPFYDSEASEFKGAGASRRSIANFADLRRAFLDRGADLLTVTLEGKSPAWQMALFRCADVVVAQHGASLANLLWGRPGLHVVEIMPQDMPALICQADFFGALARRLEQTCRKVDQAESHGPVDIDKVIAAAMIERKKPPPEHVETAGDPDASALTRTVREAFDDALIRRGKLPAGVLDINGMSGRKYRFFINNLIERVENPRYLEVGSWAGSTLCAAVAGNRVRATAVDDWSQFGGPAAEFFANVSQFCGKEARISVLTSDFRQASVDRLGPFNVYLFDGPHSYQDQYDGLAWAIDSLDEEFVFIVDDWNWARVRNGTVAAMADLRLTPVWQAQVRTTLDESHGRPAGKESDWHNGYFIAVLRKGESLPRRWLRRLGPPRRVAEGDDPPGRVALDAPPPVGPQLDSLQRADGVRRGADGAVTIPRDCPSRHALFGPYARLTQGDYRLEVCLSADGVPEDRPDVELARIEVCAAYGQTLAAVGLTAADMTRGPTALPFTVPKDGEDLMIEYRLVHFEQADLRVSSMDVEAAQDGVPSSRLWREGRVDYLLGPILPRQSLTGGAVRRDDGTVRVPAGGPAGHVVYGPYLLLPAGAYRVLVRAAVAADVAGPVLAVDVTAGGGAVLAETVIGAETLRSGPAELIFDLPLSAAVDGPSPRPVEVRTARLTDGEIIVLAVDLLRAPG
jgi:hypothetical protein